MIGMPICKFAKSHAPGYRVLDRILKMPVQNSNSKISAHPDIATNILQILISTTFNSLSCQTGQFILQLCPRGRFVKERFGYNPQKVRFENSY